MKNGKLFVPVIVGLIAGQVFADMDAPIKVVNTLRFGYNDNLYRNDSEVGEFFVHDIIDLAFEASMSERTSFFMKSKIHLKSDGENNVYPNFYALLNHSLSPRLLLSLSDKFTSRDRSGDVSTPSSDEDTRSAYWRNDASLKLSYVFDSKNRLDLGSGYGISKNEDEADEVLDNTRKEVTFAWAREVNPQQTRLTLQTGFTDVDYDNAASNNYTSVSFFGELGHTFGPNWQGTLKAGAAQIDRDSGASTTEPIFGLGLVYSPSPRTRFTGNYDVSYSEESNDSQYTGYQKRKLQFGVQHDLTAKLMAKATAKFEERNYSLDDDPSQTDENTDEIMEFAFRLTYELNRINYLEFGVKHTEKERDVGTDWEQNMIDVGWRVDL